MKESRMKKKAMAISILLMGILLFTPSCDDNLGSFRISIATVVPEGDKAYSLLLDNGKRLFPTAGDVRYSPKYNQRVYVNYTLLSEKNGANDYDVKINEIWNILTKQTIELNAQNKDSIGNDPLKARAVWVGGDYLNVSFLFNYGGVRPHAINLVKNTLSTKESSQAIDLELRHNSYNSAHTNLIEGFVCFDLKPFRANDADSVKLSIKVNEWSGDTTYDVIYRYNQPAVEASAQMPIPVISFNEYY